MPFLLVTGHPSSGKSTVIKRLVQYFEERGKEAIIIRDEDSSIFKRDLFLDSHKVKQECFLIKFQEKDHRSFIRSLVQRYSSKNSIVICDGMNYIKGYRYELFCSQKLSKTTYGVLFCDANESTCQWLDSQKEESCRYGEELVKALIQRYERPMTKNRWDSPLFEVKIGKSERELSENDLENMELDLEYPAPQVADVPFEDIYSWLCEGVPLIENKSTATVPLAPTNFLHELDKTTQEVVTSIVQGQKDGSIGQPILIAQAEEGSNKIDFTKIRSLAELTRLRRQFITVSKGHPVENSSKIASMFVNYLNTTNFS